MVYKRYNVKQSQRSQLERELEELKWQPKARQLWLTSKKDLHNDDDDKDDHDYGS